MSAPQGHAHEASPLVRPTHEVGDLARAYGPALLAEGGLRPEQARALGALAKCRTAALGGHLDVCGDCGFERPSYNSCRNRHCPKCQALAQHRWLEARRQRLLPVHHFHVVFTVPPGLRALLRAERRLGGALLMRTAARTLSTLGRDPRHLGAELGLSAVLHTWSRDLSWHPHVHCVVTGGGLDDAGQWVATRPTFLLPVRVLAALFRGRLLDALDRAYHAGRLALPGQLGALRDERAWADHIHRLHQRDWVVYCKRPFGGADAVFAYLGRYTHRIGLSNRRLLEVTNERVTFRTKHGKTATLPPRLFLRRFLDHVLPDGFVRIRHYGLLASSNVHTRLAEAHRQLPTRTPAPAPAVPHDDDVDDDDDDDGPLARERRRYVDLVLRLTGVDLRRCPRCQRPAMNVRAAPLPRGPP